MALFFNADQMSVAAESYKFWRTKTDHLHACALLGNEAGETGFIWKKDSEGRPYTPKGDHGEANGIFQWHSGRAAAILKNSGHDVINGTHLDMLEGAYAEMTGSWSHPYNKVWPAFVATKTTWGAINELVVKEEQSAFQSSDIIKRSAIAVYFDHQFQNAVA